MCSFRGVLDLCCFLADERSCGENSDTESTTVGQFVCIFYGHTQSLPEMTFWWTRKSHKFQVDIPALGAKYILSSCWYHISFSRFIRGTAFSCRITDLREISIIMRQTSKLKYVLLKELETIILMLRYRTQFYSLHSRPVLLVVTDLEYKWLIFEVSAAFTRSFVFDREKRKWTSTSTLWSFEITFELKSQFLATLSHSEPGFSPFTSSRKACSATLRCE